MTDFQVSSQNVGVQNYGDLKSSSNGGILQEKMNELFDELSESGIIDPDKEGFGEALGKVSDSVKIAILNAFGIKTQEPDAKESVQIENAASINDIPKNGVESVVLCDKNNQKIGTAHYNESGTLDYANINQGGANSVRYDFYSSGSVSKITTGSRNQTTVQEFDESGKLTRLATYDNEKGTVRLENSYVYDKQGNVTKSTYTDEYGAKSISYYEHKDGEVLETTYDDLTGRKIKESKTSKNGDITRTETTYYAEENGISGEYEFFEKPLKSVIQQYENGERHILDYDENGRAKREMFFDTNGRLTKNIDLEAAIDTSISYSDDGRVQTTVQHDYMDYSIIKGKTVDTKNSDGRIAETIRYDENDRPLSGAHYEYDDNGEIKESIEYKFDENGNITEEEYIEWDNHVGKHTNKIIHQYDDNGYKISSTMLDSNGNEKTIRCKIPKVQTLSNGGKSVSVNLLEFRGMRRK